MNKIVPYPRNAQRRPTHSGDYLGNPDMWICSRCRCGRILLFVMRTMVSPFALVTSGAVWEVKMVSQSCSRWGHHSPYQQAPWSLPPGSGFALVCLAEWKQITQRRLKHFHLKAAASGLLQACSILADCQRAGAGARAHLIAGAAVLNCAVAGFADLVHLLQIVAELAYLPVSGLGAGRACCLPGRRPAARQSSGLRPPRCDRRAAVDLVAVRVQEHSLVFARREFAGVEDNGGCCVCTRCV